MKTRNTRGRQTVVALLAVVGTCAALDVAAQAAYPSKNI
jgi:hypothetical protein